MFCSKCGNQVADGTSFCPNCGNSLGQQAQPQVQPQPQPQVQPQPQPQTVYVQTAKPKIPGRGLGISGMIMGIIGLVYAFYMLLGVGLLSEMSDIFDMDLNDGIVGTIFVYSIMSILAVSLAGAGRSKGYKTGVSMSGIVMGVIGIVMYLISMLIVAGS